VRNLNGVIWLALPRDQRKTLLSKSIEKLYFGLEELWAVY